MGLLEGDYCISEDMFILFFFIPNCESDLRFLVIIVEDFWYIDNLVYIYLYLFLLRFMYYIILPPVVIYAH